MTKKDDRLWLRTIALGALRLWAHRLSWRSLPFFCAKKSPARAIQTANRRDVVHVLLLFLAYACLIWIRYPNEGSLLPAAVIGLGFYRIVDILVSVAHLGITGELTGPPSLAEMTPNQLHRNLIVSLLLYLEFMAWFTHGYLLLSHLCPDQFGVCGALSVEQAFHLSLATQTTIGYGTTSPQLAFALALATLQFLLGLIVLATVVVQLVSLITSKPGKKKAELLAELITELLAEVLAKLLAEEIAKEEEKREQEQKREQKQEEDGEPRGKPKAPTPPPPAGESKRTAARKLVGKACDLGMRVLALAAFMAAAYYILGRLG